MILGTHNATQTVAVAAGTPVTANSGVSGHPIPYPITLRAKPGSGGTLLIEYRISPTGDFVAWPAGTVSAAIVDTLNGPVDALRFTATTANGTVEIAQ